ncbi:MAG: hypothetical protein IKR48_08820 [Kiritimatiellae bacterium]|nr:hypothetical protein [Kiritimatiellia bacterium]
MNRMCLTVTAVLLTLACRAADASDAFAGPRAEFAKYYRQIVGKEVPQGAVTFAIDPKVSASGKDAYAITSEGAGVKITGSNLRSVFYGVYDLLERRGGCRWFWDGDIVPKKGAFDLSGLNVKEEAHFEYRGIRYFAHRGLTRFQAEHWGLEDWKKEIDWCLKRRLNVFMLRIGQDDLFQLTFPEVCAYPDPSKPLPGHGNGYDDRSLFWSLQYRGKLRRDIQKYGFDRGLMVPEDFGTMTHWYSRTPEDFLDKMKPPFLPQTRGYTGRNGLVWDIRDNKWVEEYWKMTKVAVDAYGEGAAKQQLLHTIGLGERMVFDDRKQNLDLKIEALKKFLTCAHRDYPDTKVLIAGWDFYNKWRPDEVKALLPHLDPKRDIIWDYEADVAPIGHKNNFTTWGVIGNFPYTFSIFLAYEKALDARANYPIIEQRQKLVQNDPACVGYIFWPESSHTDTLCLRFFTANAWSKSPVLHGDVLDEMCASRYGEHAALMRAAWKAALPASYLRDWGENYSHASLGIGSEVGDLSPRITSWMKPVTEAQEVFGLLSYVPWNDPFIQRDTIDIARMALDRVISLRIFEFSRDFTAWRKGKRDGGDLPGRAGKIATLAGKMADLLALHTDYSLWESYQRLDAIEKVTNPEFTKTLFENASCGYCRSHQYELARYWYAAHIKAVAANLAKAIAADDRKITVSINSEPERVALKSKPLESLKPTLPRTEENFRKVMREIREIASGF